MATTPDAGMPPPFPSTDAAHASHTAPPPSTHRRAPRRVGAVVMILEDVLYDHTNLLAHFAIERAIHQLVQERVFASIATAYDALHAFRHAFGYRLRFPRFLDSLTAQQLVSEAVAQRVTQAYYESRIAEARTIQPFASARATLQALQSAGYQLGLVCVGKKDVQTERLHTLALAEFFGEIVFVASNPQVAQLARAMKEIGRKLMLPPSSILFVGRKVFYEIKAANQVGLITVQMLHGKYGSVMPVEAEEQPDFKIDAIDQLGAVVQLANQQKIKPKIVALGGGTGLAVLLKELRHYPADLTAIVTVFDSGRHSGTLRKYLGMLPPGDIRNCLVALSDSDEVMSKLMNYRFTENFMEGCSLGNLLLAALTDIQGSFDKAITSLSDILNIHGNVLPATLSNTELCAELEDGTIVVSEVNVRSPVLESKGDNKEENGDDDAHTTQPRKKPPIKRVFLQHDNVEAFLPAVRAIENADIIVLSPGGFYTSIIATLLVPGIRDAIQRRSGATVYISNVATQCGQTDGMTLLDTLRVLQQYLGGDNAIDYVIANNTVPPPEVMASYMSRGETLLLPTEDVLRATLSHHYDHDQDPSSSPSVSSPRARRRPVLLQGKTFEDVRSEQGDGKKEWNKAHMIKHSGAAVAGMLYRIIDKELESMRNTTITHDSLIDNHSGRSASGLAGHPAMNLSQRRQHTGNRWGVHVVAVALAVVIVSSSAWRGCR